MARSDPHQPLGAVPIAVALEGSDDTLEADVVLWAGGQQPQGSPGSGPPVFPLLPGGRADTDAMLRVRHGYALVSLHLAALPTYAHARRTHALAASERCWTTDAGCRLRLSVLSSGLY